jgi:pSer/pThr/pTyr-binding forkhead associated (FHA) protein
MPKRVGLYWTDAQIALEIFEPGAERPRPVPLGRPFALIGRIAHADIRFEDRGVSARHVYLHADDRGLFAVDLATRTGTRFNEAAAPCGWLRTGDSIEVAGRVIRVESFEVDGRVVAPPPCSDNMLADAGDVPLVGLTLEPVGQRGPSWALGSELAFVGRNDGCAIRLNQASVSRTHCALLRTRDAAYVIDLPGRPTLVNGQPPRGATALTDGDVLTLGQVRFVARIAPAPGSQTSAATGRELGVAQHAHDLARLAGRPPSQFLAGLPPLSGDPFPIDLVPPESRDAVLGWMLGALHAGQSEILRRQDDLQLAVHMILQHLQSATSAQNARLDAQETRLDSLLDELKRLESQPSEPSAAPLPSSPYPYHLPPDPPRPAREVPPAPEIDPARSFETAAWLLERIDKISNDNKLSLRSILARIGARKSETHADP